MRLSGADAREAKVLLRLWSDGEEKLIPGNLLKSVDGQRAFSFVFNAPREPQLIWYYFIIDTADCRMYLGARSGEGRLSKDIPPDYQITVYDPNYTTPEWFREGTVYQIFPDRFFRGTPDESGQTGLDRARYHEDMGRRVIRHERWDEPVEYRPLQGERFYQPCDYYGGDLRGIMQKLPYLASLGVTVLYLNPIFEAASNHRYNTADYLSVDPILGSMYDLNKLITEAKKYGIRLMLDGVFSHTGDDSIYFNRYGRYNSLGAYQSKESPYFDWYEFREFPDDYRCWWDFDTLPEVDELSPSYMRFIKQVLAFWANIGITSWRLDVADELPDSFIEMLRSELKKLDPQGVLLGEVWEDASNKQWRMGTRKYVYGNELDSVMNYPFRKAVCNFLTNKADAYCLLEQLGSQRERYPEPFYRACMNVLGSHDSPRILSVLSGAPERGSLSREQQAKYLPKSDELRRGRKLLRLALILQFSMPQPPCVYYGDEAGMLGMYDPFNRASFPWEHGDEELLQLYGVLGTLRRESNALRRGGMAITAVNQDVFAIYRRHGSESILTIINRSESEYIVSLRVGDFAEGPDAEDVRFSLLYIDLLSHEVCESDGEVVKIRLKPFGGYFMRGEL